MSKKKQEKTYIRLEDLSELKKKLEEKERGEVKNSGVVKVGLE